MLLAVFDAHPPQHLYLSNVMVYHSQRLRVFMYPTHYSQGRICDKRCRYVVGWLVTFANCGFLIAFHSNYGSALLSFPDMTTGRTTDDGPTTATMAYLALRGPAKIRVQFERVREKAVVTYKK